MADLTRSAEIVKKDGHRLSRSSTRQLIRDLALGHAKRSELARQYEVTPSAITQFARRHQAEIDDLQSVMALELVKTWIADKTERVLAYQAEYELSASGEYAEHYEQIRTRLAILHQVAEELGQLPPRMTTMLIPVAHVVESGGEDVKELLS